MYRFLSLYVYNINIIIIIMFSCFSIFKQHIVLLQISCSLFLLLQELDDVLAVQAAAELEPQRGT